MGEPTVPSRDGTSRPGRAAARGAIGIYLAEAVALPTGLLTLWFLTHRLGPVRYGHYAVAVTLVIWLEQALSAVLSKATVRLVSAAGDWRPIATSAVRAHLLLSLPVAAAIWIGAGWIARLFHEPVLGAYLRLLAIDVPLFALARAHRHVLVGRGEFGRRALASAGRWVARLLLIVLLVEMGMSVNGALLGGIGATLVELILTRIFVRPPLLGPGIPIRRLLLFSLPLFLFDVSMRAFQALGLFGLAIAHGDPAESGRYGAALNLTFPFGMIAMALSPVLLSTLGRTRAEGDLRVAREVGRNAVRFTIAVLPLAALAAGAADEIVALILGPGFGPAAALLPALAFSSVALVTVAVCASVLIAANRTGHALWIAASMAVLAVLGHALFIPTAGAAGAALVTLVLAAVAAVVALEGVAVGCGVPLPYATMLRAATIAAGAWLAAAAIPAPGGWVLVKLVVLGALVVVAFAVSGELSPAERSAARRLLR